MTTDARCRSCHSEELESVYRVDRIPVSSVSLVETAHEAATYPTGAIDLTVCRDCGLVFNRSFDQSDVDYTQAYEDSQAHSPTFVTFAQESLRRLDDRYSLAGKTLLEVGCGKAEWLGMACRLFDAHGVGIDPAYVPGRVGGVEAGRLEVHKSFYGEDKTHLTGDLVACRHTLEHISDVAQFTGWLAESVERTEGAALFVEVPDTGRILDEGAFWDVYYEHASYFTATSLVGLLERSGLAVADVRLGFADQYLLAEAQVGPGDKYHTPPVEAVVEAARSFGQKATEQAASWHDQLADGPTGPTVVWAASSKTVAFLAAADVAVAAAVDINPKRQGAHLPGSATPIVAPEALRSINPATVVIMNPIYRDEIERSLVELGIRPRVLCLEPQSIAA